MKPDEWPDFAQPAAGLVEAEDDRTDGPRLLSRAPAHHDGVDRAHALDLDHARTFTGAVGRIPFLGDHALGLVQPALGVGSLADHRRELDGRRDQRLQRGAALPVGQVGEKLVALLEEVERDEHRGRLLAQPSDPRRGRMDSLADQVELLVSGGPAHEQLAVEDVASGREADLGEVARERLAVARLKLDVVTLDEGDRAEPVPLGLIGPARTAPAARYASAPAGAGAAVAAGSSATTISGPPS